MPAMPVGHRQIILEAGFLMTLHSKRKPLTFVPRLIAAAAFLVCAGHVLALDPFTVTDIRVEGIQRTEAGTVFSYLPVRVGDL